MDILDELKTLTKKLREENIEYALYGGLALAIYALPRATLNIDILIEPTLLDRIERIVHGLGYTTKAEPMHFHDGKIQIHRVSKIEAGTGEVLVLDMLLVTPEIRDAWNNSYCAPAFALAESTSRLRVFALQKNAFPAGNAWKSALSRQFINRMSGISSSMPNAMCAAIATRSVPKVPLRSLLMTPKK